MLNHSRLRRVPRAQQSGSVVGRAALTVRGLTLFPLHPSNHAVDGRTGEGGWRLLWNDNGEPKNETAAQLAFQGIASAYCEANKVVLDREVELGRGPVDFKFSNGSKQRALLEVKKLDNGRFWNGLRAQLPSYLKSDQCSRGWLMAIRHQTGGVSRQRARTLPREVAAINHDVAAARNDTEFRFAMIDARRKPSASKLTPDDLF